MFQDWQTVAVWLIILAALAYVVRRGWARIRSFRAGGKGQAAAASCATGCGSCGDAQTPAKTSVARPQKVLVQITGAGSATRRPK
ncbi:MAG TPA: hypothetical protein VGX24_17260 [Pyrinomonadaceae bacterium]|jgi:cytochrome c553|nr:hypothetical protein [Pyrinomonadaceae bacterium]